MSDQQESRRLGSLWTATVKSGKRQGQKYLKGTLDINGERIAIVVFKNDPKKSETSPDWAILESRPFEKKVGANRMPPREAEDAFL